MSVSDINPVGAGDLNFEPKQDDVLRYTHKTGIVATWEGDGWWDECRSWFETSYIHAGISGFQLTITGSEAQKLLSDISINNVYKWPIGKCKHLVQLDDEGLITNHALFMRDAEDVFRTTAGIPNQLIGAIESGAYDARYVIDFVYIFQFSGPKSLTILEKLCACDLHDVGFLDTRKVTIPSLGVETEICRIGMSGTLAYELRGPKDEGPAVYAAAYEAGKEYGIKRLGWRSYPVNHTFGGFPQQTCSFETAMFKDPVFREASLAPFGPTGSIDPADERARFRSLSEVNWLWMAKLDHDFIGRAAVEAEMANPTRTIVSLIWNPEDLVDIYRSLWEDGEPYKYMEFPSAEQQPAGGHQDYVVDAEGNVVGWSSVPIYSSWYRKTISPCAINLSSAEPGTELIVKWGDFGGRIKDVRVTVAKYPFIDADDNRDYDMSAVEYGNK